MAPMMGQEQARRRWDGIAARRLTRRRLLQSGALLSAGGTTALLAACSSGSRNAGKRSEGAPAASAGTPRRGGRYGETFLNSPNFNPIVNWQEGWSLSGRHVYDRLLTSREDEQRYDLEAARTVEQPDPTTIVFRLKPNLLTHDEPPVNGRPITAEDVVATQNYVLQVPNAYDKNFETNYMASVEAPDDATVVFKLKRPNAYVFSSQMLGINTSQVIIPREMLEKDLATTKPVGSGPRVFS